VKKFIPCICQRGLLALLVLPLFGCTSKSLPLGDIFSAVVFDQSGNKTQATLAAKLNPDYRYLRVEAQGQPPALMVLGYVDPDPLGDIQVWYSSQREVIKLQNGRIVSTTGLETNWRAVRFSAAPPAWSDVPHAGVVYTRLRDEMPGHRYALADRLQLKPLAGVPSLQGPASLPRDPAKAYRWFSETTLSSGDSALPPSWFALATYLGQPTVVYSRQCLSAQLCLTLQLWPAQEETL
jgi:hypothetical protein